MKILTKKINDLLREKGDKTTDGMIILLKVEELENIMDEIKKEELIWLKQYSQAIK